MVRGGLSLAALVVAALGAGVAAQRPAHAAFPGANGKLAFTRHGAIYVVNSDGTGLTRLTAESTSQRATEPAWSPDGTKIAFARACGIYVMDADGSGERQLAKTVAGLCPDEPTWSPDGTKIAFIRQKKVDASDAIAAIYVMNADGTGAKRWSQKKPLTRKSTDDRFPAWSPDGTVIAFSRNTYRGSPNPALYAMGVDGKRLHRYAAPGPNVIMADMPAWSPDGTKIAFGGGVVSDSMLMNIYVMNVDGTMQVDVTGIKPGHLGARYPAWSPDGRQIAFASAGVWTINVDGTGRVQLTTNLDDDAPDWQPLG